MGIYVNTFPYSKPEKAGALGYISIRVEGKLWNRGNLWGLAHQFGKE